MATTPKKLTGTNANDTLTGTSSDDVIFGLRGNDALEGSGGNDLLNGGSGADDMHGGAGNDTYVVDNVLDRVVELAGKGDDTEIASLRVVIMVDNLENLSFTTSARHTAVGNELDNVITGNAGIDRLVGKAGNDTLWGRLGDDYLSGGDGNDKLYGGSGNDTLTGGAGDDLLDGGFGGDRMSGGKGNDVYMVTNLGDRAVETNVAGIDEVYSTVDYKLGNNIEKLFLIGGYSIDGTGNRGDNLIVGNDQNNILKGMGGKDTLIGGKGDDTLFGGHGADKFVFSTPISVSGNTDTIADFSRAEGDKIQLSQAIFADFETGRISPDAFYAAPGAKHAVEDGQFLIYNTTTGVLYYDTEGPGGRSPIPIAEMGIGMHPLLNYADFVIIA